jgi:nuclear transport factor 2 (NTF2) superfamily protein
MASTTDTKPPAPPFTLETARIEVKAAQVLWNTKNAYTDSVTLCSKLIEDNAWTHQNSRTATLKTQSGVTAPEF